MQYPAKPSSCVVQHGHHLADGLKAFYPLEDHPAPSASTGSKMFARNIVTGQRHTDKGYPAASVVSRVGLWGRGIQSTASGRLGVNGLRVLTSTLPFSVMWVGQTTPTSANTERVLGLFFGSGDVVEWGTSVDSVFVGGSFYGQLGGGVARGNGIISVCSVDPAAASTRMWHFDGANAFRTGSGGIAALSSTLAPAGFLNTITFCGRRDASHTNVIMQGAALWQRMLTDEDVSYLLDDPFCFMRPRRSLMSLAAATRRTNLFPRKMNQFRAGRSVIHAV